MEERAAHIFREIGELEKQIAQTRQSDQPTDGQFVEASVLLNHLEARQGWFNRIEQLRRQLLTLDESHLNYSLEFVHENETYLERNIQASNPSVLALLDQLFLTAL